MALETAVLISHTDRFHSSSCGGSRIVVYSNTRRPQNQMTHGPRIKYRGDDENAEKKQIKSFGTGFFFDNIRIYYAVITSRCTEFSGSSYRKKARTGVLTGAVFFFSYDGRTRFNIIIVVNPLRVIRFAQNSTMTETP